MLKFLLLALALLTVAIAVVMWIDSLIFYPERFMPDPPHGVTERWITADDGVRIHAWHANAGRSAPSLVWSHGNGGNIAGRGDVLLALRARGLSVLAYDYRGYGKSEGTPSEAGVYRDALAAYDSERARGTPTGRIVCFGESLGGAVSLYLASERPCAGVAVVATFTTLRDVGRVHFGPLALLAGARFDSLTRARDRSVPLLVAHGDRDEIIPFALGERLYQVAAQPKWFLRVKGAHHNDVFGSRELLDAIARFAFEVTGAKRPP